MAIHIGVDLGTSGCRAVAIGADGSLLGRQHEPLPAPEKHSGRSEQNPEHWWQALQSVLQRLIPTLPTGGIETITVDGTSSTLLLTDRHGTPLTPALMYDDRRATIEAEVISRIAPRESGAHGPSSSLAKLLWLLKHSVIDRDSGLLALHQADWVSNRLCGKFGHSDENNSLKLGYDPIRQCWPEWIKSLGLPPSILPTVAPPGIPYATLRTELASRWGVPTNQRIMICSGTTDSVAATVAAGIHREGDAVTSLGTTLVLKLLSSSPLFSPEDGIYSHRLGDQWLISGASNTGAGVLLDYFSPQEIEQLSSEIDPNHLTGLNYYLLPSRGERFPVADPDLQPRLTPRPSDDRLFLQGILEGLAKIEEQGYRKMRSLGGPALHQIITSGGGAGNLKWQKIRANQFHRQQPDLPISIARQTDAAYGAALLPTLEL